MSRPQEFDTQAALSQAMLVFWRKGYEGTSLADLLQATGLSKSSLYATFNSKRDLFLTAFDDYRQARAKFMSSMLNGSPARVAIEKFFRMVVSDAWTCNGEGCMSINQAVELAPSDAEVATRVRGDLSGMEKLFVKTIQRGHREGSIASSMPALDLARVLILAFPGLQVMVRAGCEASDIDARLTALLVMLD
jgi:TetR/AcrR family transcriptional regulator, transcriptional repressor for nem operon